MPRYPSPSPAARRPASNVIHQTSDAMLFGITRGVTGLPRRDPGSAGRQFYRPGETFEESYPRFEFSTLVSLVLTAVRQLIEWRRNAAASNGVSFDSARETLVSSRRARHRQLAR